MQLLDSNPEVDILKQLLETGASVNAPPDPCEQSPVHLAAGGGLSCFLLWQLQTGADLNQQDVFGEAPLHKAAKVGSMECLSLLVASDAQIDLNGIISLCNCCLCKSAHLAFIENRGPVFYLFRDRDWEDVPLA
ncbi:ankyrin repeat domain-containing protein 37 isoform X3 [Phacochoerus africanus]|uniref:ankyrin repeat domain-containing protein 37 isoform X3 n=1 Tax=Phacochoerus africanus TaxID=41426 RepID=UPI001FDA0BBB|nr:ankyrin repeat domain-containing protein 37 isoform X3 [Phacochoerus africanus]